MHHAVTVLAGHHAQTDPNASLFVGVAFVVLVIGLILYLLTR